MRITRLVAEASADPQDWMDWLSTLALALGLPDPLPEPTALDGPEGPLPVDPNRIERSTIIPLSSFPTLLRPPGVPVERRSVGLTMIIRRAIYSAQTGVDGEGRPVFTTEDRGWEVDIATYPGPGPGWDVNLLPDIITMSVMTNGTMTWTTSSGDTLLLPCTPFGFAAVTPLHPNVVWATYQPPAGASGPLVPPVAPGGP